MDSLQGLIGIKLTHLLAGVADETKEVRSTDCCRRRLIG
jgi:hypothetical protein